MKLRKFYVFRQSTTAASPSNDKATVLVDPDNRWILVDMATDTLLATNSYEHLDVIQGNLDIKSKDEISAWVGKNRGWSVEKSELSSRVQLMVETLLDTNS